MKKETTEYGAGRIFYPGFWIIKEKGTLPMPFDKDLPI